MSLKPLPRVGAANPSIGIRKEDLLTERRAALSPDNVKQLVHNGFTVFVERSSQRIFEDASYERNGATLLDSLHQAPVLSLVFGIKEIKIDKLRPGQDYACFSHTIKGQENNMPLLRAMIDGKHALLDYECIRNTEGKRLVFFGFHAGVAGAVNSLWAFGQRKEKSAFTQLKQCRHYHDISEIKATLSDLDAAQHAPISIAILGTGNAGQGAASILDCLPPNLAQVKQYAVADLYRHRATGTFDRKDYLENPDAYDSIFRKDLDRYDIILNCIYWEKKYPKLVTTQDLSLLYGQQNPPKLHVIGDISCDVGGSIEVTSKVTWPDDPCYEYDAVDHRVVSSIASPPRGPTIMAVYNLPAEVPRDASIFFGNTLCPLLIAEKPNIQQQQWGQLLEPLRSAFILLNGQLQPKYTYLAHHV